MDQPATVVTIDDHPLTEVHKFTYFGSTHSRVVCIDDGVASSRAKASGVFVQLHGGLCSKKRYQSHEQAKGVQSCSFDITIVCSRDMDHFQKLNHFQLACLIKFLRLCWQDKVPDTEVLS